MADHVRRARSDYRQFRLTLTQETSGLVTYRLHGKGYEDDWNDLGLLLMGHTTHHDPIETTEQAIGLIQGVLESHELPRDSSW
jgi:hypothetical protein